VCKDHPDFWGLREFYSTVRAINRSLVNAQSGALDGYMLLNAVLRNFGGRPMEITKVVRLFFRELGLIQPKEDQTTSGGGGGSSSSSSFSSSESELFSIEYLISRNLEEPSARHLMLLTKSNAALGILFDHNTLTHSKTEIIFGSDFPLDQSDLQVCVDIQRIKLCMAEGITVVLVHCESLYESLYDLLNQVM
jgi:E3 ubiquitin-protein ligase RNF213